MELVSPLAPVPTVVCVDDDTLIREGVARLVPGVRVVGVYDRAEECLAELPHADVVVLDLSLSSTDDPAADQKGAGRGPLHGALAVRRMADAGYTVLIYTNERRREVLAACFAAGAARIVHKSESLDALGAAVCAVHEGQVMVTTALAGLAEVLQRRGRLPSLSERQVQVLRARARGETFRSIGQRLFISPKTAEEYMGEVGRKFADFLREHSAADLERHLGLGAGDLLDQPTTRPAPG